MREFIGYFSVNLNRIPYKQILREKYTENYSQRIQIIIEKALFIIKRYRLVLIIAMQAFACSTALSKFLFVSIIKRTMRMELLPLALYWTTVPEYVDDAILFY